METARAETPLDWRDGRFSAGRRVLAAEAAVAISFNGVSHAVMMASPSDLEDLARGFALSEGIAADPGEIEAVTVLEGERGFDVQLRIAADAEARLAARRRAMAGPVGCGMCGLESIDAAMRAVPAVAARVAISPAEIAAAAAAMVAAQTLNAQTRAVHGAGFWIPGEGLVALREDVGRHNALDKLIGAFSGDLQLGAIVLSSRVSIELIQKAASAGCGLLLAVSAPTALAVDAARQAGITLAAVVRGNEFEVFTHPGRIREGALPHVA
ncbi:MAG: formate dehydrogenase accessory sulfurtransferase FdhD [Brucellaceae bacterium]|nr:formate dehydrogenase accessory sulfurtransferase FdhD [Brucellaceae bacterium]